MSHPYLLLTESKNYAGKLLVGTSATSCKSYGEGLTNKSINIVEIPSKFKGKEVAEIGFRSFHGTSITSIFIPKTIESIYRSAFENCHRLSEVRFEEGSRLQSLGLFVFYNCKSLKKIDFPASVSSIATSSGWIFFDYVSLDCFSYEGTKDFSSLNYFFYSVTNVYVPSSYEGSSFARKSVTGQDKTCGVSKEHFEKVKGIKTVQISRDNIPLINALFFIILS